MRHSIVLGKEKSLGAIGGGESVAHLARRVAKVAKFS